jgi:hypothetical protein
MAQRTPAIVAEFCHATIALCATKVLQLSRFSGIHAVSLSQVAKQLRDTFYCVGLFVASLSRDNCRCALGHSCLIESDQHGARLGTEMSQKTSQLHTAIHTGLL